MRCLIVAPEIEDPQYRGIQMILKHLIRSASESNIEVYLLTGNLSENSTKLLPELHRRVNFIYLKHYLTKGMDSFRAINKKLSIPAIIYTFFKNFFRKPLVINIPKDVTHFDLPLLDNINHVVDVPYFYQGLSKGLPIFSSVLLQKVIDQNKIDFVVTSGPIALKKLKNNFKLVQFVHDFIPLTLTEDPIENKDILKFAKKVNAAIVNSDLLLTNSDATKADILSIAPKKKVEVLNGAFSAFSRELEFYKKDSSVLESNKLLKQGYYLFVSALEKRKNVARIARAFVSIANDVPYSLVLAGKQGYKFEELISYLSTLPKSIRSRIIIMGHISEHDKYTLMKNAFAFVYPSLFEGFGIPVLEALGHGCPTITTRVGGIPEIAQEAVYYIENPYSEAEIAQGMVALHNDLHLYSRLRNDGPSRAKFFTEDAFKEKFIAAINQLNFAK